MPWHDVPMATNNSNNAHEMKLQRKKFETNNHKRKKPEDLKFPSTLCDQGCLTELQWVNHNRQITFEIPGLHTTQKSAAILRPTLLCSNLFFSVLQNEICDNILSFQPGNVWSESSNVMFVTGMYVR